jgi:hypothetical protein
MTTALAPVAPSLFDLEQDLQALLDTDDIVDPERRAEFEYELAEQLKASVAKRDRVSHFILHCVMQQENCDREISRLKARRETFARAEKRIRQYVMAVIQSLGPDAHGKPKKLEGNLATFALRQTPGCIAITDEEKIPTDLKSVEVCLPLKTWQLFRELYDMTFDGKVSVDKREAKRRIDAGEDIPGIDLTVGGYTLVVK